VSTVLSRHRRARISLSEHGWQDGEPPAEEALAFFQKERSVRQSGKRIVQGHIGNPGFRPALLGNVEVCCHPPATGHGLSSDTDKTAIGQFIDPARSHVRGQRGQCRNQLVRRGIASLTLEDSVHNAVLDDFTMGCPRLQQLRREPIHFPITIVAYDKPLFCIEHAQALAHIVDRRIKPLFFQSQRLSGQFESM
jgi:hypothetical protein